VHIEVVADVKLTAPVPAPEADNAIDVPTVPVAGAVQVIVAEGELLPPPQAERINAEAAAPTSRVSELREICTMLPPMAFVKEINGHIICESAV